MRTFLKGRHLQGYDVIFYGDSITEQWRGSAVGADYPSLQETHSIFQSRFNTDYTSSVMAVAGMPHIFQFLPSASQSCSLLRLEKPPFTLSKGEKGGCQDCLAAASSGSPISNHS